MGEELIYKLVEFLETASPMLWEAAARQSIVNAWVNVLWFVILAAVTGSLIRTGVYCLRQTKEHPYDEYDIGATISLLFGAIAGWIAISCLTFAIKSGLNPTYYAILNLIELIPGS
jgi:hypothetical protein